MTDEEIVRQISQQTGIAVALQLAAARTVERLAPEKQAWAIRLRERSNLFAVHVLRLIATHKAAVTRWMESRGVDCSKFEASDARLT